MIAAETLVVYPLDQVAPPVSLGMVYLVGADLERDRLERRVKRMKVAIAALRQHASEQRRELGAPAGPLRHAIADFEAQIEAMNARLRYLAPEHASTQ